jgi:6-phosphogluconolactonase (cycloisomerase 2 family)
LQRTALTRRDFLGATASVLVAPIRLARSADAAPEFAYAYIGTYTPNGGGIYLFRLERSSGALTQLKVVEDIRNPSWLAVNQSQTRLYAVSEIDNYADTRNGAIVSYSIDGDGSQLTRLGVVSSAGTTPTHASVHPTGKYVFAANYGGGNVAVFPVGANGALGEASDVRPSVGPRHRARAVDDPPGQFAVSDHDSPHMHMVAPDPSGQFVIANDAGLDLTLVWRFDAQAGRLLPADVPAIVAPPGSAPRHFVFHPNGRVFYNLYEHDAKIAVYDYDPARGGMRQKQLISTLPPRFGGSTLSSEIIVSADGRFLYAANRIHNAVAAFAVAADGQLRLLSETWARADSPRCLTIEPGGDFLYSCNQKGDSITSFRISAANGALQFTGRFEPVGSPTFMTVIKARST